MRGTVERGPCGFLEFVSQVVVSSLSEEALSHNTGICWRVGIISMREEDDRRKRGKWI